MQEMNAAPNARTIINGREVDYFAGTGYFGLHGHSDIVEAACLAARQYGIGSATIRGSFGNNPVLLDVERKAAKYFEKESALYFASGYLGNLILLQGLVSKYDVIFIDAESHYSVVDGAALVNKPVVTFRHRDPVDLQLQLRKHLKPGERPLVYCDGIAPATGEIAPLDSYQRILFDYERPLLCVDDAHAVGVIGKKGQGCFEYFNIHSEGCYFTGTLSKAFGGHGGFIVGSEELINTLKAISKIPFSASSVPIPAAAASAKALEMLMDLPQIRNSLWDNVAYAKKLFRRIGFDKIPDTPVPIICLSQKNIHLEGLQKKLFKEGIVTHYLSGGSYSAAPKEGALRVAIFSTHSKDQIDRLAFRIGEIL